jgi:branched-chain amino acid transport system ATP-binding protein
MGQGMVRLVKKGNPLEITQTILRLNNVEVKYHEVILVLKGVSLEIPEGGIIALLGANGAGKSTTLKAISGLLKVEVGEVTDGTIEFRGERIHRKNPGEIAKMGIIQVIEGRKVFEHLTVEQKRSVVAGYVSGGEQQMTVIGRALMAQPKLMLLDEPSMGLAPILIKEIFEIITKFNHEEKIPILLVEQNVKLALTVAPYAYVLENGRLVMHDTSERLKENPDIRDFYLGLSDLGERKSFRQVKHYKRRKRWLT